MSVNSGFLAGRREGNFSLPDVTVHCPYTYFKVSVHGSLCSISLDDSVDASHCLLVTLKVFLENISLAFLASFSIMVWKARLSHRQASPVVAHFF